MEKYRLIGVTKYAKDHLSDEDLENLVEMIGCIISDDNEKAFDGDVLFDMPDGVRTHAQLLEVELLKQEDSK